ncbi:neurotrypsin-like [Amphiura filiformis]|uniref:neurotrypsin-like n=1 Tax=Amphiura filiformis TaxID=82378 RepID=UPI003B22815C
MEKATEVEDQVALTLPKAARKDWRCFFLIGAFILTGLLIGLTTALIIYQTEGKNLIDKQVEVHDEEKQQESELSDSFQFAGMWQFRNETNPGQHMRAKPVPQLTTVRLVDSAGVVGDNGRVEILDNNKWKRVCSNNWDDGDATVVCRQLAYPVVDATTIPISFGAVLDGLLSVECLGTESHVNDCTNQRLRTNQCSSGQDAGVSCVPITPPSPDTTPPAITCPGNQPQGSATITAPVGQTVLFTFPPATATDTFDNGNPAPAPTITYDIGSPSSIQSGLTMPSGNFAIGTSTVTATATDSSGNTAVCTFTVTVVEGQAVVTPWDETGAYSSQWQNLNNVCGRSSFNNRIIGGVNAPDKAWPWACYLYRRQGRRNYFTCTAELLSSRWALTAAHCVSSSMSIVCGTLNLGGSPTTLIDTYFRHPSYNSATLDSDLALLKLRDPLSFTDSVKPVCPTIGMSDHEKTTYGIVTGGGSTRPLTHPMRQPCYVIGWGQTDYPGGSIATVLQEVLSPLIMPAECGTNHGYSSSDITDNMICTSTTWSGSRTGSCFGDSGGPMMCKNPAGYWDLVGITSWGYGGCAHPSYPDVLTRVSPFGNWIYITINNGGGPNG